MRNYELMLILRANLDKKAADEAIDKIVALITNKDGQATRVKGWGRRKLAYEIDKQSEGIYALFKVTLAPNALEDIKFNLKLDENIIRYTFVKDTVKSHEASSDEVEKPVVSEEVLADDDSEKDNVSEDTISTEPSSDASTLEDTPSAEDESATDEAEENTTEVSVDESSEVETDDE